MHSIQMSPDAENWFDLLKEEFHVASFWKKGFPIAIFRYQLFSTKSILMQGLWLIARLWAWKVWCFIKMYYIGFWSLGKQLWEKHKDPSKDLPGDLCGQVAIVTGGDRGIGFEVARALVKRRATVVIGTCDMESMTKAVQVLKSEYPTGKVDCIMLNLGSFRSIQKFVEEFKRKYSDLHILINNAGVMFPPFTLTEDGFEEQFAINYLGHLLVSLMLLPWLRCTGSKTRCARIINVTSSTHLVADKEVIHWFHSKSESFTPHSAYANSKLAIVLATYHLNRRLARESANVTVNCLHPGVVHTALYQHLHWISGWIFKSLGKLLFLRREKLRKMQNDSQVNFVLHASSSREIGFLRDTSLSLVGICDTERPYEGAHSVLYAALSQEIEREGALYIDNSSPSKSLEISYSTSLQQQLWDTTSAVLSPYLKSS